MPGIPLGISAIHNNKATVGKKYIPTLREFDDLDVGNLVVLQHDEAMNINLSGRLFHHSSLLALSKL